MRWVEIKILAPKWMALKPPSHCGPCFLPRKRFGWKKLPLIFLHCF